VTTLAEIPSERDRLFVPKGSLSSGTAERVYYPRSTAEAAGLFVELSREAEPPPVTLVGSERSFDAHFLPARGARNPVAVSARELKAEPVLLGVRERDGESVLAVRVEAGVTLGALLDFVTVTPERQTPTADTSPITSGAFSSSASTARPTTVAPTLKRTSSASCFGCCRDRSERSGSSPSSSSSCAARHPFAPSRRPWSFRPGTHWKPLLRST